jgi:hypothetical protein
MTQHTHDAAEGVHAWSRNNLARHLSREHGLLVPMAWDLGRTHQAHLDAHTTPEAPEEAPMPLPTSETKPHEHEIGLTNFHARAEEVHGPAAKSFLAAHLNLMHGVGGLRGLSLDELKTLHLRLHEARGESAHDRLVREGRVTGDTVTTEDARLEEWVEEVQAWYEADPYEGSDASWNDLGQETRDYYRNQGLGAEAGGRLQREVDTLQIALNHLTAERDGLERRLAARTRVLKAGRGQLQDLVDDIESKGWGESNIARKLREILAGTVSTDEPRCTEPHLGLATTREMLEEITTRIDLGHCGLDYRTVDGDL